MPTPDLSCPALRRVQAAGRYALAGGFFLGGTREHGWIARFSSSPVYRGRRAVSPVRGNTDNTQE